MFLDKLKKKSIIWFSFEKYNRVYKQNNHLCERSYKERTRIKKFYNIEYMSREIAAINVELDENFIDYLLYLKRNNIEHYLKIVKNSKNLKYNTGLIDKDGFIEKKRLSILKNKIKNLDDSQSYYKLVMVFNRKIVTQAKLYNYKNINEILSQTIHLIFEKHRLDKNALYWFYSIHTDSNSFHIHLIYFEIYPSDYQMKINFKKVNYLGIFTKYKNSLKFLKKRFEQEILKLKDYYQQKREIENRYKNLTTILPLDNEYENYTWDDVKQIYIDIKLFKNRSLKKAYDFYQSIKNKNNFNFNNLDELNQQQNELFEIFVKSIINNSKLPKDHNNLFKKNNFIETAFKDSEEYIEIKKYLLKELLNEFKKHKNIEKVRYKSLWYYFNLKVKPVYNKIFHIKLNKIQQNIELIVLKYYFKNDINRYKKIVFDNFEEELDFKELETVMKGDFDEKSMK